MLGKKTCPTPIVQATSFFIPCTGLGRWHSRAESMMWADLVVLIKPDFDDDPNLSRVGELSVDIATEGNLLEASRLTEAMFELAYTLKAVAA